jgi:cytoskeletal protein RodZ
MSQTLVIIAISIIIAGFVILAGVALWLALERRKQLQPESKPALKTPSTEHPAQRPTPRPEVASPASVEPAKANEDAAAAPAPKKPAHVQDVTTSAEYPQAGRYDQTWIPNQPRKSKRPKTEAQG